MRKGIIDMGTNTFHLLIADGIDQVIHQEKVAVRLGKGGISDGILTDDAMDRAITTLLDFHQKLKQHKVEEVCATATSAVRSAKNQNEFVDRVKQETEIDITILDGSDEAFLIHQGVLQYVDFKDETGLIVDIGGGSIELIIADDKEVKWLRSYEIGGQRLIDRFHKSDPISLNEVNNLIQYLEKTLVEVFEQCKIHKATHLIGSSGSFDTFWDIFIGQQPEVKPIKPGLTRAQFENIHDELLIKDKTERLAIPGMIPMRVDMIVGASVVTKCIMDNCSFDLIKISPFALKEGVLAFGLPKRK